MKSFVKYLAKESKYLYDTDIRSVLVWLYDLFEKKAVDDKRPRDRRPLLKVNGGMGNAHYGYSPLHMALLSADRQVFTCPTHCRDYLNEAIRWHVCNGWVSSAHCNEDYEGEIDMRYLRLVLLSDSPFVPGISPLDGIKNGVRLANMYGRVAGWSPIRVSRALVPSGEEDTKEVYVLVGDRNWQRTPQYISMLILLIRVCLVYQVPEWITDAYALTGWWHEFLYNTDNRPDNSDITVFLTNSYHHMLLMVAHDREIFPHNMLTGYSSRYEGFHGSSGLNSLIKGESIHPESTKRLKHYYATEVLFNG